MKKGAAAWWRACMERGGHILPADTFPICCINRQKSMDLKRCMSVRWEKTPFSSKNACRSFCLLNWISLLWFWIFFILSWTFTWVPKLFWIISSKSCWLNLLSFLFFLHCWFSCSESYECSGTPLGSKLRRSKHGNISLHPRKPQELCHGRIKQHFV